MNIHWVKDLPLNSFVYDDEVCLITKEAFDMLADYTRSQPTGASPGRIYKKNLHWSGPPENWFVYVCVPDPEPGWTQHDGRRALRVEGPLREGTPDEEEVGGGDGEGDLVQL